MAFARDKFWMFGVRPHQDDIHLGRSRLEPHRKRSRITPAEGAAMLDLPNMLMIGCQGQPVPYSEDAYGYADSFVRMNKVMWGASGSSGFRIGNEEKFICDLAEKYPNITGAFLDDLFHHFRGDPDANEKMKAMLHEIRTGLDKACRPMEMYMVWYIHELDQLDPASLDDLDGITIWTKQSEELIYLEERFEQLEKVYAGKKIMLGIYMFDFFDPIVAHPIRNELMEVQCELALRLLKEGRIEGIIFEANSVMGVGLESEKWLREWIDKVKYTEVPD